MEADILRSITFKDVVSDFAKIKFRKMQFRL